MVQAVVVTEGGTGMNTIKAKRIAQALLYFFAFYFTDTVIGNEMPRVFRQLTARRMQGKLAIKPWRVGTPVVGSALVTIASLGKPRVNCYAVAMWRHSWISMLDCAVISSRSHTYRRKSFVDCQLADAKLTIRSGR